MNVLFFREVPPKPEGGLTLLLPSTLVFFR